MDINELLAKYSSGHRLLSEQLKKMPKAAIFFKASEGKWSAAEIIVHLADSEAHSYVRGKKIIAECGGKVCVYNHQVWADKLYYEQMDYHDALELIRIIRKSLSKVLTLMPEESWDNYIFHPETGKITLLDWIQLCNDHIDVHIQQMQQDFDKWKKTRVKRFGKHFWGGVNNFISLAGKRS